MVDVVFYLEGDRSYQFRVLRTVKNRFGSTAESGLFVMEGNGLKGIEDPSKYMLRNRSESAPGSMVVACMEGLRPVLVEMQALTVHSVLAIPRRIAAGYDYNRMIILLAVLEKGSVFPFPLMTCTLTWQAAFGSGKQRQTWALPWLWYR